MGGQPGIGEAETRPALMDLKWTTKALSDLVRLHEFLAPVDRRAAARTVQSLVVASGRFREHPRVGEKVDGFEPREVRRLIVGRYEIRYEIANEAIYVLRIWHTREQR